MNPYVKYADNWQTITSFREVADRLIAVDTEYQTIENIDKFELSRIERETTIHQVWCAAFSHNGEAWSYWTDSDVFDVSDLLYRAAEHFGVERPIFVSYAYFAEWEAFQRMGIAVERYQWVDVHLLYRLAVNCFGEKKEQSLAAACKAVLGIDIDTAHKDQMRALCISGEVAGNERQIMDYCAEDTARLVPLLYALEEKLSKRLHRAETLVVNAASRGDKSATIPAIVMDLMASLSCFTVISHRGLPVNGERLQAVRAGARVERDRQIRDFIAKYPNAWRFETPTTKTLDKVVPESERIAETSSGKSFDQIMTAFKEAISGKSENRQALLCGQYESWYRSTVQGIGGAWKRDDAVCREYLRADLEARGLLADYPRTSTGALSLAQDALKDVFGKQSGSFGGDFRRLVERLTCYNGILAESKSDWLAAYDEADGLMRYRTLSPFSTVTGRCAPSPSKGWVFGWDKSLYCVLEPAAGKWLVELDFSSEETFIQAQVFNDAAYRELYASKDIYLYTGVLTGMIPREDFESMEKSELKAKYKRERDLLKTFTLAIGYGAGDVKLAGKTGMSLEEVAAFRERYNKAFSRTTAVRQSLRYRMEDGRTKCLWLANGWHAVVNRYILTSYNSPLNFPVQGTGSVILHKLVQRLEAAGIRTLATIHDAIFFEVDADDPNGDIPRARDLMKSTADEILGVQDGEVGMKVGEPEIVKHGEIWTPEHSYDGQAKAILLAGGYHVEM